MKCISFRRIYKDKKILFAKGQENKENRVPPKQELLTPEDLDKGKRFLIRQISIRFLLTQNQTCVDSLNTVAKVLKPTWLKSIRTWTSSESSNHAKLNRGYETKYFVASHRRSDFTKFLVTKLHFQV